MVQDGLRDLVRLLTREVIAVARPEKMATFAEDFAALAISGGLIRAEETLASPPPASKTLDTTLVAGMFFQVLREAEHLPVSTPERVSFIRRQAKSYLATRLAGQIPLSQFFRLLNLIEEHVHNYFEEVRGGWLGVKPQVAPPPQEAQAQEAEAVDTEALREALNVLPLLPKGRRKLTTEALMRFLADTGRHWFKLLDFEEYFGVNKKTAWSYLSQLLQAGILEHNGEKANRVRYLLARPYRRGA